MCHDAINIHTLHPFGTWEQKHAGFDSFCRGNVTYLFNVRSLFGCFSFYMIEHAESRFDVSSIKEKPSTMNKHSAEGTAGKIAND